MPRHNKITAVMIQNVKESCNATPMSKKQYIDIIKAFGAWVKGREGTERIQPEKYHELIQAYITERGQTVTAQTVNKDLAALVNGTGEHKQDYIHPKRNETPTRGRNTDGTVKEGKATAAGTRLYNLAHYIGIREKEYLQLRGRDIKTDRHGLTYIHVSKGKGGKEQWQLVNPAHAKEIQATFASVAPGAYVFDKKEVDGCDHANLHGLRREHARNMYEWFMQQSRASKDILMNEVKQRYADNPRKAERGAWRKIEQRIINSPTIQTRGHNKATLQAQGRETTFNREGVIFVSVMCLSHYREDVTVSNYLC